MDTQCPSLQWRREIEGKRLSFCKLSFYKQGIGKISTIIDMWCLQGRLHDGASKIVIVMEDVDEGQENVDDIEDHIIC